jgi:hypothetical protein
VTLFAQFFRWLRHVFVHAPELKPLAEPQNLGSAKPESEGLLTLAQCRKILLPSFDTAALAAYIGLPQEAIDNIEAGNFDAPVLMGPKDKQEEIQLYPTPRHAVRAYIAGLAWAANIILPPAGEKEVRRKHRYEIGNDPTHH